MLLEGTVVKGAIVLDAAAPLPEGSRVRVEPAGVEPPLHERFRELRRQWKEETLYLSSITQIAMHPAYQRIIGMGRAALPLIFQELRREADHWFWALKAITGEDPVPASDRGKLPRMAEAWLTWAGDHGY
jgi:hypothetical protein